jgi:uracil-DNA glycosylase
MVIVAAGAVPVAALTDANKSKVKVTELLDKPQAYKQGHLRVPVVVEVHPSFVLHKPSVWHESHFTKSLMLARDLVEKLTTYTGKTDE